MRTAPICLLLLGSLPLLGCPSEPTVDPIDVLIDEQCEGTNPRHCMLPWPSQRWLVDDASTATGFRLQYGEEALPENKDDERLSPDAFSFRDGYSPASQMLTTFAQAPDLEATPGAPLEGMWQQSLAADSASVVIDLDSGERIPHMIEIDRRADVDGGSNYDTLVYIRPAYRLQEDRSYGVALRGIVLQDGSTAEAFPVFAALRDGTITTSDSIEARRPEYEALFAKLEEAGVPRGELQQAWSFHTASGSNLRAPLIAMRDDAVTRVPVGGGTCTVEQVWEDYNEDAPIRLDGTFTVPLYMDSDRSGAHLALGDDGLPEFQGWAEAPFTLLVPAVALEPGAEPQRLLQFGHGLMGAADGEGGGGFLRGFSNEYGYISVATDWWGMSERDISTVARALADLNELPTTTERLAQGVINNIIMTRSFLGACKDLPELQHEGHSVIGDEAYFLGISQGGIMGASVMALHPDIERASLLVGAMAYPVMIGRSVDFTDYEVLYEVWYEDRIDRELLMNLAISLWDNGEPNPWLPHLTKDPIPGNNGPKNILYAVARDDSQVPNLASDMAVRTMGIPLLTPSPVEPWGIEQSEGPEGSAYLYIDTQDTPHPPGNLIPEDDNGAHGRTRYLDAHRRQMDAFFRPDGVIEHTCEGPCDPE